MSTLFHQKIITFIQQHHLIRRGDHLLLGVSGGMDSIVLLHVLSALKYELGINLSVATLNHHLRPTSANDVALVKKMCTSLQIPCYTKKLTKRAVTTGSLEEYARIARYTFFQHVIAKQQCNKLVLAHHQNDVAETVLLNILRGSGLNGLKGILPMRSLFDMNVIRPLLCVTRQEIKQYATKNCLTYCHDETNDDLAFSRNKIRHKLLPYLEKNFSKDIYTQLNHLAITSAADIDYLDQEYAIALKKIVLKKTSKTYVLSFNKWAKYSLALRRGVLRIALMQLPSNVNLNLKHILLLEQGLWSQANGWTIDLPNAINVKKSNGEIIIQFC